MTLVDHLYELRYRLGWAAFGLVLGGILGFIWFSNSLFGLPTLGDLLIGPYCQLPDTVRFSPGGGCRLMQTEAFEVFMLRLKVGIAVGAVLTSPLWLYQLWAFITPGLYSKERKYARTFVSLATVLFVAGAVLAYYVVPEGLGFMTSFGGDSFFTALTGGKYINFVLLMVLMFGVSFEMPLVLVMLNRAGVVSYAKLKSWWRGIVFGLFVLAAIATPGQDPFSMLVLAACLVLLFVIAMVICRAQDRAKAKKLDEQGLQGVGLDEASNIDHQPSSLDSEEDTAAASTKSRGQDDAT